MKAYTWIKLGIALLILLAIPLLLITQRRPVLLTKVSIKGLETALYGFTTEYGHAPAQLNYANSEITPTLTQDNLIASLMGTDAKINPRLIRFYQPQPAKRGMPGLMIHSAQETLVDAWGNPFNILTDSDGDGNILSPDPGDAAKLIHQKFLIYSAGPDGDPSTWHDNINSWK